MLDLLKICYTCLDMNGNELVDVSKLDFDNETFLYKLKGCVSPDLEETALKQICSVCIKQLRLSYQFKEMVLLSQKMLRKHKDELLSDNTHLMETKLNQLRFQLNNYSLAPFKSENKVCTRRGFSRNIVEECFEEMPVGIKNDSEVEAEEDSCDYFLNDLKKHSADATSVSIHDDNNIEEFLIAKYQCGKCNIILEGNNIEQHSCDGTNYGTCDDMDAKEIHLDSKDVTNRKKRGRPKKREKSTKPDVKYECYHCGLIYNKRWKLQKHISRAHNDDKKYVCTYCNKAFKQSYHLREHLTSHTGERNFSCSFCDKSFQRISSMKRHIKSHEAAPGHKTKKTPFLCTVCGKRFPFSNGVQRHMRIHLGIKNHECVVCNRRFTQSTHLHVHMRTHTGEKPYICDTCGEAFSLNASLQKHMSIHQDRIVKNENKLVEDY